MRVGTAEREDAIRALGEHFAAGRLPISEYEERVGVATEAITRGDLRHLFVDLPTPYPPFMAPPVWAAPPPQAMPVYPAYGQPVLVQTHYSDKSKVTAGLLQILLPFGAGRFYTGHTGIAVAQLLTCGGFGLWCLIDGIILLTSGGTDAYGRPLRD